MTANELLRAALMNPGVLAEYSVHEWEAVLALGWRQGLSGRWHGQLSTLGLLERIPAAVSRHLWSDRLVAEEHARMVRWEVDCLGKAARDLDFPVVVLKGAAYIIKGLPPGAGRLVSDVDILVPEAALPNMEIALKDHGWHPETDDDYDDKYFREWMHELPPFRHALRGTVIDLHHNILPRTCRLCPPAANLLARSVFDEAAGIRTLSAVDMVLHSIVHGFYNGEFTNCLRDVLDVHELLTHFAAQDPGFWSELLSRSEALGLQRPVYYAVRYAHGMLGTAVPDHVQSTLAAGRPSRPVEALMDFAVAATFIPSVTSSARERLAFRLLQIRAHWIKMPVALLVRHLGYKTFKRLTAKPAAADIALQ